MPPQWHFNRRRPCERMRDSANDAFFTAESLDNLSEALVREAIQNSLDAAERGDGRFREVRVRIVLEMNAAPAVRDFLLKQFSTARNNFERGLGLCDLGTLFGKDCGYVLIEDFGTRGLTGDIAEWRLDPAHNNAFFSFFRAEGRSFKEGESLGRWGIGKQVFPTASRVHAMFGVSVRNESPERVLMGSAVVKTHTVGDDDYQPDGWFGLRESDDQPVQAVTSTEVIDDFARMFGLQRGNVPGLSVVVPASDDRIDIQDIRRGIVRSFFWPILSGELVIDLEASGEQWRIDADSLTTHSTVLPPGETANVDFAVWAATAKPAETVCLPDEGALRPIWKEVADLLLPDAKMMEIRSRLDSEQRVAIKVPVRVRPKNAGGEGRMSFFTVYIELSRDSGLRPMFLRDGIAVSDVRCPSMTGCRALVVVDDAPLAGLLGDAEGVNHTQWQKDSPKFHNRYVYGDQTIKFVTRSVYEIMQRLRTAETKGDPSLLLDLFYLSADEGDPEPTQRTRREKGPDIGKPPGPLPPSRPKKFKLDSVKGGFILKPGEVEITELPLRLRVKAGYAVRRGDAVKRWTPDDFVFMGSQLRQEQAKNVIVSKQEGNTLEVEIRKADFLFGIHGFDTKRDLVIKVSEIKADHEANV